MLVVILNEFMCGIFKKCIEVLTDNQQHSKNICDVKAEIPQLTIHWPPIFIVLTLEQRYLSFIQQNMFSFINLVVSFDLKQH